MEWIKILSKTDAVSLLEMSVEATRCRDEDGFRKLVRRFKDLLRFDGLSAAYGSLEDFLKGDVEPLKSVEVDFPDGYMERFFEGKFYQFDPVLIELFKTWEVQHWKDTLKRYPEGHRFYEEARDWAILDGFSHGVVDADMRLGTAFSFIGDRIENNDRSRAVLECLVPHLAEALKRIPDGEPEKAGAVAAKLTPREVEILNWLKEGKTSYEISSIFKISERTVNFHIQNLKAKLNAMSRAHAVAIAARCRIIEL